jgi:hypothetical protein
MRYSHSASRKRAVLTRHSLWLVRRRRYEGVELHCEGIELHRLEGRFPRGAAR